MTSTTRPAPDSIISGAMSSGRSAARRGSQHISRRARRAWRRRVRSRPAASWAQDRWPWQAREVLTADRFQAQVGEANRMSAIGAGDDSLEPGILLIVALVLRATSRSERIPAPSDLAIAQRGIPFSCPTNATNTGLEGFLMYGAARPCITVGVAVFRLSVRADYPMRRRPTASLLASCLASKS